MTDTRDHIWLVIGLRRSGLHLLAEWLLSATGGVVSEHHVAGDRIMHAQSRESVSGRGDALVFIIEDMPPAMIEDVIEDHQQRYAGLRAVIALRSVQNVAASRINLLHRKPKSNKAWRPELLEWWKRYASSIAAPLWLYDRFIADENYRRQWRQRLGIAPDDARVLSRYASRDSFTHMGRGEHHPENTTHLARADTMRDDPIMQAVLRDDEAMALSRRHFGAFPA